MIGKTIGKVEGANRVSEIEDSGEEENFDKLSTFEVLKATFFAFLAVLCIVAQYFLKAVWSICNMLLRQKGGPR